MRISHQRPADNRPIVFNRNSVSAEKLLHDEIAKISCALQSFEKQRVIETVESSGDLATITCTRKYPKEECFVEPGGTFFFKSNGASLYSEVSSVKSYPAFFVISLINIKCLKEKEVANAGK